MDGIEVMRPSLGSRTVSLINDMDRQTVPPIDRPSSMCVMSNAALRPVTANQRKILSEIDAGVTSEDEYDTDIEIEGK